MTPTLSRLLAEDRALHAAEHGARMSNHLPMCLSALERLGAGEERLAGFTRWYAPRLSPPDDDERARCRALAGDVRRRGRRVLLAERLGRAVPGLAGAAFHGLIRTAYGVLADDDDGVAWGLAYLDVVWPEAVLEPGGGGGELDAADALVALGAARIVPPSAPAITPRLRAVAADERFRNVVAHARVRADDMPRLVGLAASSFAAAPTFAPLHALTAAHALLVLWDVLDDKDAAVRAWFVATAACAVVARAAGVVEPPARRPLRLEGAAAIAIARDDDHLAKLVCSLVELERFLGPSDALEGALAAGVARR